MVRLVILLTLPLIIDPFHTWKPPLIRKDTKLCLYGIRERWECSTLFLSQSTRRCPYLRETFGEVWALSSLLTETTGTGNVRLRWMLVQSSTLTDRTSTPPTSSTLSPPTSSPRPDSLHCSGNCSALYWGLTLASPGRGCVGGGESWPGGGKSSLPDWPPRKVSPP